MSTTTQIEDHLTQIRERMAIGERDVPERLLKDLIGQMGPLELSDWRVDIMRIVDQFQKKRRRGLLDLLGKATDGNAHCVGSESSSNDAGEAPPTVPATSLSNFSDLEGDFRQALSDLHERHIFQWSTFYRDYLSAHFERFLGAMTHPAPNDLMETILEPLANHTHVAFSKGYDYARTRSKSEPAGHIPSTRAHNHELAIKKSINGLSRLLALPLDFYLARSSSVSGYHPTLALRVLVSAALSGILDGYTRARFGRDSGSDVLPRFQRQWVHYVAFLTPQHAERIIHSLNPGPLQDGLNVSVLPLLDALQRFFDRDNEDYWPVPVVGQYSWPRRRLSISIRSPESALSQRLIEVGAFLEGGFVEIEDLNDAAGRQMALVLAPLRPDARKIVDGRERLKAIVVPVSQTLAETEEERTRGRRVAADSAFSLLDDTLYELRSRLDAKSPITYNFAREFPLRDPQKATFYHVVRKSVRDLLRTFERSNGIRLWCSVRRSGKTTACLDMETTTGNSSIIGQTCGASQVEDAGTFYRRVREAVSDRGMLSETFVKEVVAECGQVETDGRRTVLIIDEYETLFGLLGNAARDDASIRYNVVQPILDQFVEFSHHNLLVFLGQQPDAHFILMDQNQLAPYVKQDSFPLFEHVSGTTAGEFSELVKKILGERIECQAGFLDALFEETAGHPFLTANVLVEFIEWLIERRRPQRGLKVRKQDFTNFSRKKLDASGILRTSEYDFFRRATAEALSEQGYRSNPWLFMIYWILRLLSSGENEGFRVSQTDFQALVDRIPIPHEGQRPECVELLRTATQANFLSHDERQVRVKIRTLGRIAGAVPPKLA